MFRRIKHHEIDGRDGGIEIHADEFGPGGASHHYEILVDPNADADADCIIDFQKGTVQTDDDGVTPIPNGITNESLIAVVIDRLECFQCGPYPCDENERALDMLRGALATLQQRTRERMARGVEGKMER